MTEIADRRPVDEAEAAAPGDPGDAASEAGPAPVPADRQSRRRLLAGALGGAAALAAGTLIRPEPVAAASLVLGTTNSTSTTTRIASSATTAFRGDSSASSGKGLSGIASAGGGIGVSGLASSTGSTTNFGVLGEARGATGRGVRGVATHTTGSNIGVMGQTMSPAGIGVYGLGARGVVGESSSPSGAGIVARNKALSGDGDGFRSYCDTPSGAAVYAEATALYPSSAKAIEAESATAVTARVTNNSTAFDAKALEVLSPGHGIHASGLRGVEGRALTTDGLPGIGVVGVSQGPGNIGISAESTSSGGIALQVIGQLQLSCGGTAPVASNGTQVSFSPGARNPAGTSSIVLATIQTNPANAVAIKSATVESGNIVIRLTGAPGNTIQVGWFLFEPWA